MQHRFIPASAVQGVNHAEPCPVTLVTTFNATGGMSNASIDGQRTYITSINNTNTYGATTDLNSPKSLPVSGTIWVEPQNPVSGDGKGEMGVGFVADDFSAAFYVTWASDAILQTWRSYVDSPFGTNSATDGVGGTASSAIAVGVNSSGDCRVLVDGIEYSLSATYNGVFSGKSIGLISVHASNVVQGTPRTTSILLATQSTLYNTDFSGIMGTNVDWCGNSL